MNLRADAAECKFFSLAKQMLNMKINIKIRVLMLNSLINKKQNHICMPNLEHHWTPTWTNDSNVHVFSKEDEKRRLQAERGFMELRPYK